MNLTRTLAITLLVLLAASAQTPASRKAQALMQSAQTRETINGDLKGAIDLYRQAARSAGQDRALAAQALLHIASCQEKMGAAEARKTYQEILNSYADQKGAVAEARTRLASIGGSPASLAGKGVRVRLLWDGAVSGNGTASADGRWLSFPNWETGDVGLRDLIKGESRVVTNKGGGAIGAETESTAVSPDGKRIAFTWCQWRTPTRSENGCELRLADVNGGREQVLLNSRKFGNLVPKSWSPDGRLIVATAGGRTVMLVPADGSQARTLPISTGERTIRGCVISPDGKWLVYNLGSGAMTPKPLYAFPLDVASARESEILADAEVMGFSPDGGRLIYYREKDDVVQLFHHAFSAGRVTGDASHSHSIYAHYNIHRGVTSDGSLIYSTENFPADVVLMPVDVATAVTGKPSAPMQVKVVESAPFLGGGARFSPDGKKILYSLRPKTLLIRTLAGGSEHTITVQLRNVFGVEWAADSNSLFAAGPGPAGFYQIHRVDLITGVAKHLFNSARNPIITPSPDGNTIYYVNDRTITAHDLKSGTDRVVAAPLGDSRPFDMRISRDGKKLIVNTNQGIRVVDTVTGESSMVFDQKMLSMAWSADSRYILAIVAREKCCYGGKWELVSIPLDGGSPVRKPLPEGAGDYRGLWLSPDGKQMATQRVNWLRQVWALDNFLPSSTAR